MFNKKRLLIIDDEEQFAFLVKSNLETAGDFAVFTAKNAEEGLKIAKSKVPDIILLDITMPGKDGFSVLEALKKEERTMSIPVVMLTAVHDDDSKLKTAQLYCEDYITKPIPTEELKNKIKEVLNRYKK
ncbi:MAG: response regulator [Candidatus Omnitrophica bacterium]|nr:response regulator [Candidatus Omnitrophota bacterium]MBU1924395.1 response regulator [Candidatus Omnitrophota bacterium]